MKTYLIAVILALFACIADGQNKTYFISPDGNDQASGLSIGAAWKSLDRVNRATFLPGDKILFKSGGVWQGQLKPNGSGEKNRPILLSSYGDGAKPVICIGDAEGAGIRLYNQSWWEIENMEVTSGAPPVLGIGRQGIVALVNGEGQAVEHIVVRNCYIHDIWGQLGGNTEYTGYNSCAILVQIQHRRGGNMLSRRPTLQDVLIENNRIERFDKCGIIVRGCRYDLRVRHNYMENLGGDGIFVGGCYRGMIEHNVAKRTCMRSGYLDLKGGESWWPHTAAIWIQDAEETVMQYNAVYDTGRQPGNGDGFAYDFDFYCKRCIAQYNYSRNNHGFLLLMNRTFENVARYNISENDQTHLVQMQCDIADRNVLYNNVFYIDYGTVDLDFFCGNDGAADKSRLGATYYNNIFYATGQSYFRTAYSSGEVLKRTFDESTPVEKGAPGKLFYHNCYFGPWKNGLPDDPKKLTADPLFIAPGTGGEGLASLGGYRLQPNSPCINRGMYVPLAGEHDFWGNPLEDGQPDFGAYEQIGSGVFADTVRLAETDRTYRKESDMAWAKWSFPLRADWVEEKGEIEIRLLEPLAKEVKGTLTWIDSKGKKSVLALEKQSKRDVFAWKVKGGKEMWTDSSVQVSLQYEGLNEEWNIPVLPAIHR